MCVCVCLDDSWPLWALLLLIVFVVLVVLAIIILIYLCLMHCRQRQQHNAAVSVHIREDLLGPDDTVVVEM